MARRRRHTASARAPPPRVDRVVARLDGHRRPTRRMVGPSPRRWRRRDQHREHRPRDPRLRTARARGAGLRHHESARIRLDRVVRCFRAARSVGYSADADEQLYRCARRRRRAGRRGARYRHVGIGGPTARRSAGRDAVDHGWYPHGDGRNHRDRDAGIVHRCRHARNADLYRTEHRRQRRRLRRRGSRRLARGHRRPRARGGATLRSVARAAASSSPTVARGGDAPRSGLGCSHRVPFRRSTPMRRNPRRRYPGLALGAMLIALALFLAACGSSSKSTSASPSTVAPAHSKIVVGQKDFAGAVLLSQLYGQALAAKGFAVSYKNLGPTEVTYAALKRGDIDLYGEYQGTLLTFLKGSPTGDAGATNAGLQAKVSPDRIKASTASTALDENGFYVTKATAEKYNLSKLSDLTAVAPQLTFGGPPECQIRPLCLGATEKSLYNL